MVQGARHSGAKSHGRGIRDLKHQNPTYLVLLESSSYPEIIFDVFEKYGPHGIQSKQNFVWKMGRCWLPWLA